MQSLYLTSAVLLVSLALYGCDGGIKVKGHVYAQNSSTAKPQVFVDEAVSNDVQGIPIADAKVTLYHAGDYSPEKVERNELRSASTATKSDGSFEVGGLTSPFRFNAALVVEKPGYKTVTKIFYHDKLEHEATIFLVRE